MGSLDERGGMNGGMSPIFWLMQGREKSKGKRKGKSKSKGKSKGKSKTPQLGTLHSCGAPVIIARAILDMCSSLKP